MVNIYNDAEYLQNDFFDDDVTKTSAKILEMSGTSNTNSTNA